MTNLTRYIALLVLCLYLSACERTANAADAASAAAKTIDWQAPLVLDTGPAYAGPWRMNDSEFHYVDDAAVSLRDDGTVAVTWVDNERQDVFFQRYDKDTAPQFDTPVNVSRSADIFSWLPKVWLTADDRVYIVWQEIVFSGGSHGGEIFFARSDDGGRSFTEPQNLSNTVAGAGKGRLSEKRWDNGSFDFAVGPKGEIFIAWTEYEGPLRFRRSLDGGRSFSEVTHISGSGRHPARAPVLALGPNGELYLAWTVGENATADIRIARSDNNGESFEPERLVHVSGGHSDAPGLAVDGEGSVHLVYAETPVAPSQQSRIHYVRLNRAGEAQSEPRVISGNVKSKAGGSAPSVAVDHQGRVYVVWEHHPTADQRAHGLGFALSPDAGQTFTALDVIPGSRGVSGAVNGSLQGQLGRKLSVSDGGDLAVVNSQLRYGDFSRIVLIRGDVAQGEKVSGNVQR